MNANKLKGKMKEAGMTQANLAGVAGVSLPTLNAKINGVGGRTFTVPEAGRIVEALKLSERETYEIFFA